MRCDATKARYALQCRRTGVSWLVDGRPMCTEHAIKASVKLDDDKVYQILKTKGREKYALLATEHDGIKMHVMTTDGTWQPLGPLLSTEE